MKKNYQLPFPVDYLHVNSGYTSRLIKRQKLLIEKCAEINMQPLYVCGDFSNNSEKFKDITDEQVKIPKLLFSDTKNHGSMVLQCKGDLGSVFTLFAILQNIEYCHMCNIDGVIYETKEIHLDPSTTKKFNVVKMELDAESG